MSKCKLISYTQPAIDSIPDSEGLIAYTARVSNKPNQENWKTAPKLVKWLVEHKHWSPLEQISVCIEINTTRAISAQIVRHRSFSFQELSTRYTSGISLNYPELRYKGSTNRQGSSDTVLDEESYECKVARQAMNIAYETYNELVEQGVALECARMVLPLGTNTTIYMSGTLRSWIHYVQLRTEEHTQKEHRLIAQECKEILTKLYPNIMEIV
jgi:thymidylate synthase (FAD)